MPSQRPFFLSSFIAAFRQTPIQQQATKPPTTTTTPQTTTTRSITTTTATSSYTPTPASYTPTTASYTNPSTSYTTAPSHTTPQHSANIPIPPSRRRGSDSSTEGFREAVGAEKWYIGGRTAGGEEKFFKLGVVRRVRSNDGLSLDRLSL